MKLENKPQKRRRYDAEFKSNVIELHKKGRSIPSLALSFGLNENMIYRWKKEAGQLEEGCPDGESMEIKRLRKQLKEVEQERDILKKALGIFSRPI